MSTTRTMQDQDLVAKSKNLCLQNSAGSGTTPREKSRVSMAWKATGCDSVNATISMCTDFLVGTTSTVCFDIGCRWKGMAYAYALTSGL
jgi:hypothetical protein